MIIILIEYLLPPGLLFSGVTYGSNHWCGFRPEWNTSQATINYLDTYQYMSNSLYHPLDTTTGVYHAEERGWYAFTVTATVGGMLPPKPGDLLLIPSPVYGQIFVKHNGMTNIL